MRFQVFLLVAQLVWESTVYLLEKYKYYWLYILVLLKSKGVTPVVQYFWKKKRT